MSMQPSDRADGAPNNQAGGTTPKSRADGHGQQRDHGDEEGEDEGSAPTEGDESGLKENQKSVD
ncbi:hypothetical protein DMC47_36480 [Nostoc sp. 3335mG]|nr:hypothetical protein DMC47_36480 [Nostoc sp. 3335mG]